jgi:hypothetical protein
MTKGNPSNLRVLIDRYKSTVASVVQQLRSDLGRDDLLRGWRQGSYPQEGRFGSNGEMSYSFHGVGCRVESERMEVDFDFGEGGRADGFDAWRLYLFADNYQDEFPELTSSEAVQAGLDALADAGELVRSGSLVYTTESFHKNN